MLKYIIVIIVNFTLLQETLLREKYLSQGISIYTFCTCNHFNMFDFFILSHITKYLNKKNFKFQVKRIFCRKIAFHVLKFSLVK